MSAAEPSAIVDVERTVAIWRANKISARDAWHQLTGRHTAAEWGQVKAAMIRMSLRQQPMQPMKRTILFGHHRQARDHAGPSGRFRDDLRAVLDHGSPGWVSRPYAAAELRRAA